MRAPVEVSLAGYETTGKGGLDRLNYEYVLPSDETLTYFAGKGIRIIRLPLYWDRLQPAPFGALATDKAAELDAFLDRASRHGVRVIADLHAFGRRDDHVLGSPELPITALSSFWGEFSERFRGRFFGYDIMNEPHDMPSTRTWPDAAQATVDEIRQHDRTTTLYVEGDDWSNAARWPRSNGSLNIHDPVGRLVYSAHLYFDHDTSGQYRVGYDEDGATPVIGAERLQPFVDWLRTHKVRGHIGEFGAPYGDPRWIRVLDEFLNAVVDDRDVLTGVTYWAAGDWMDFYDLTLQPAKDGKWTDRPQLFTLLRQR
jgi:endoglucanase